MYVCFVRVYVYVYMYSCVILNKRAKVQPRTGTWG